MERLTTNLNGYIYFAKGKYPPTTMCAEMENWEIRECMTKLAEYEDTGLAPEEIKDINDILNENNEGTVSEEMLRIIIELAQYKKTGFAPEEIKELDRKYREDEHEYCGEYGTDDCQFQHILKKLEQERDHWKNEAKKWCDKSFRLPTEEKFMIEEDLEIKREELKKKNEYIKQLESRIKKMESDASWDKYPEMMGK